MREVREMKKLFPLKSILFFMFLLLLACDSDIGRFEKAKRSNTILAYKLYLRDYPQGKHIKEARENLTILDNVRLLKDPNPLRRTFAIKSLRNVEEKAGMVVPSLISVLGDRDEEVKEKP